MLVLITGVGTSKAGLVIGIAVVQAPLVARLVRTATLEQSVRGFVEAAVARGEGTAAILRREILPNIVAPITADAGLRFTYSIILVASVNFLGLGLQPPAADWGLMVSENRGGLTLNPYAVLSPALLIALLTIAINLTGDAIARSLGVSTAELEREATTTA
jgi:peptide/nickel transport system permease protein